MGEKYLSDVIDLERDIMPFRLIQIYSGVGSGKNYWVKSLAAQGYKILFITSRRAVADAQAFSMEVDQYVDLGGLRLGEDGKSLNSIVCTNAKIESFAKKRYNPEDEQTYIWNFFDFIVLDEAHSIVTDASFCDSPFHVKQFLLQAYKSDANCKVILMTGTPEPIDWLVSEETKESEEFNQLNFYEDCIHVDPEEVWFYPYHAVIEGTVDELNKGKGRIIYFANSIKRIKTIVDELQSRGISEEDIGITYSKREKDETFSPSLIEKMDRIQDSIVRNGSIPKDIKLLITTAQNREGVNICDKDIKIMVAESTTRSELVQMAGRVRNGLDILVVTYGGPSYGDSNIHEEIDRECVEDVNIALSNSNSNLDDFISVVERKFPYIRFDYFASKFKLYAGKARGDQQAHRDSEELDWYLKKAKRGVQGEDEYERLVKFEGWFPHSRISRAYKERGDIPEHKLQTQVDNFLENIGCLDGEITKEQRDEVLKKINELLLSCNEKEGKTLRPILKRFGYSVNPRGKHDGRKWMISRGEKI